MPVVFVIGRDWTVRAGVRAELLEAGVDALGFETLEDADAAARPPDAVLVDASSADISHPALRRWAGHAAVLAVTSGVTGEAMPDFAQALRRPVRIAEIVTAVRPILRGHAA